MSEGFESFTKGEVLSKALKGIAIFSMVSAGTANAEGSTAKGISTDVSDARSESKHQVTVVDVLRQQIDEGNSVRDLALSKMSGAFEEIVINEKFNEDAASKILNQVGVIVDSYADFSARMALAAQESGLEKITTQSIKELSEFEQQLLGVAAEGFADARVDLEKAYEYLQNLAFVNTLINGPTGINNDEIMAMIDKCQSLLNL